MIEFEDYAEVFLYLVGNFLDGSLPWSTTVQSKKHVHTTKQRENSEHVQEATTE
jgi:hypothetical protein